MNIGEFRHRITLQKPTYSTNNLGESVATYSTHSKRWAKLMSRAESERTGSTLSKDQIALVIRFSDTLDSDYRLVFKDETYIITLIEDVQYKTYQRITADRADSLTHG